MKKYTKGMLLTKNSNVAVSVPTRKTKKKKNPVKVAIETEDDNVSAFSVFNAAQHINGEESLKTKNNTNKSRRKRKRANDGLNAEIAYRGSRNLNDSTDKKVNSDEVIRISATFNIGDEKPAGIDHVAVQNQFKKTKKRVLSLRTSTPLSTSSTLGLKRAKALNDFSNVFSEVLSNKSEAINLGATRIVRRKKVVGGKVVLYDEQTDEQTGDSVPEGLENEEPGKEGLIQSSLSNDAPGSSDNEDPVSSSIFNDKDEHENLDVAQRLNNEEDGKAEEDGHFFEKQSDAEIANDLFHIITVTDRKYGSKTIDFDEIPFSKKADSVKNAMDALSWVIHPCDIQLFFKDIFQAKVLLIHRNNPNYYGNLFSTDIFTKLLQSNYVEYGTNINIALYKDGERTTPNGEGQVSPYDIKAHFLADRSVQFINPQTFCDSVWHLCEVIQEIFGSFVGANTYITPAGTAGFAPHWDDVDVFLLQIEGRKHWKVFAPRCQDDTLPRLPSGNLSDADMEAVKPVFDGWIEQGDLIYIPRGFIHQGHADPSIHSLHLTLSVCRQFAFVDMLEKLVPSVVSELGNSNVGFRKSIPPGYLDMGGIADLRYPLMRKFQKELYLVFSNQLKVLKAHTAKMCGAAIDIMAREFMKTALPPMLTDREKELSSIGGKSFNIFDENYPVFTSNTEIKFIRRHAQRLIFESEESCFVIHRMANSRVSEERPEVLFNLDPEVADGFCHLCDVYPKWELVSNLPCSNESKKIELANTLFINGVLMAKF